MSDILQDETKNSQQERSICYNVKINLEISNLERHYTLDPSLLIWQPMHDS